MSLIDPVRLLSGLGYTREQIDAFRTAGVIACAR